MSALWPFGWFRQSAARWFVQLRTETVTPRLDSKFRRWLAADPANEIEYERQELAWELAGELGKDKEIGALLAEADRAVAAPQERSTSRYVIAWSAAACALIAAVGVGIYTRSSVDESVYVTAVGEQRAVVLPDESRMVMNTATRVRVVYKRDARIVELKHGEATFAVMRDEERPFEVRAARGTARALGTEFNVFSSAQDVTVSVLSGKVQVVAPGTVNIPKGGRSAVLLAGQQVTYDKASLSPIHQANTARINAWRSGRIAFEDVALEEALSEFNRYGRTPIILGEPALAELRVSGVFRIGETGALLRALGTAFDIEAKQRDGSIELRSGSTKQ